MEEFIPPHNHDAERAALACAFSGRGVLDEVLQGLKQDSYHLAGHGVIHWALEQCDGRGLTPDVVTLTGILRDAGKLDAAGGVPYLKSLAEAPVLPENVGGYVELVAEQKLFRDLLALADQIKTQVTGTDKRAREIRDAAEAQLFQMQGTQTAGRVHSSAQLTERFFARHEEREAALREGRPLTEPGSRTGFSALDRLLKGLVPGRCTVVAGRTNMGKSSLANAFALAAAEDGDPVAIFSNEMLAKDCYDRMISQEGRVVLDEVQVDQFADADDQAAALRAAARLAELPLTWVEASGWTILDIRAAARKLVAQGKCRVLILDYLQRVKPHTRNPDRQAQMTEISQALGELAKELGIHVIALAQLSRALEQRKDKRPVLSDLRESGSIEIDADAVVMIYREEYYLRQARIQRGEASRHPLADEPEEAELIVAKNRFGVCGTLYVGFLERCAAFQDRETRYEAPPGGGSPRQLDPGYLDALEALEGGFLDQAPPEDLPQEIFHDYDTPLVDGTAAHYVPELDPFAD